MLSALSPRARPLVTRSRPLVMAACTCSPLPRRHLSSSARSLAPPYVVTRLPSRALLSVTGHDSPKLLQGLVSNDVRRLAQPRHAPDAPPHDKQPVVYANILKADGRYLHDIMLFPPPPGSFNSPDEPGFLIEHDASFTPTLRTYLKRHVLRSKVKLGRAAEASLVVTAAWRNPADVGEGKSSRAEVERAERWLEERGRGWDPRVVGMGYRWVEDANEAEQPPSDLFHPVTPSHFHLHRLLHAVPEGPADFPALPLEASIDFLNGVDYRKGCYVGQELTARTHHKGVVRKRGVVFRLFREGEDIPTSPVPSPSVPLTPYPSLFPLPPPSSTLTLLRSLPSASSSGRAPRAPRPSGKLGTSLCALTPGGGTLALAYGSVRLDHLAADEGGDGDGDGVFVVRAPVGDEGAVGAGGGAGETLEGQGAKERVVERGDGAGESDEEGGRWLAKGFRTEWLEWKLEEEALSKGL
ncbi:glycine cleavage T-protein [Rhodotorula diobovata]|uniref:Glycine cleavage T-protein n=1 Tax=Rhodotorula diobovata TaxID=5288 RepID=A0A5C5G8H1_9BASI|nr:glycine cleavage T-protein [Rhodotorula diobovata]